MIDSITFNSAENKIIVIFDDGATREYIRSDKNQYLIDFPDRSADLEAMGWNS